MLYRFLLGLLAVASTSAGYALPGSCSGACNVHDPAVMRRASDNRYFRFSTGNRISIASASSWTGPWTHLGSALPSGSRINLPGNRDLWAPDVSRVGDQYVLYYSVSTFGSQNSAVGAATSPSMDAGTWADLGGTGVQSSPGKPYNAIDGSLVQTGGPAGNFMTFGSFWGGLYQVQMDAAGTKVASGAGTYNVAYNSTGAHAVEGPTVFRYGSYHYLVFSSGVCCGYDGKRPVRGEEYKIMVCRSSSATGGFVDKNGRDCRKNGGSVLLESHNWVYGPGGQ